MKVCSRCKIEKEDNCFWKAKNSSDGLQNYCKECAVEKNTEHQRKNGIKPLHIRTSIDDLPTHKICTRCKVDKPREDFRLKIGRYIMINSTCKKCDAEIANIYYEKHKDDEQFKQKNRERVKRYAESNFNEIKNRRKLPEYAIKHAELNSKSYHRNKDFINAKQKIKRQTAKYKKMMREYREKNKDKIFEQEVITKKRYHEKNRDKITDKYCINQLHQKGITVITPELIEWERAQVLLFRLKKKISELKVGETKICTMCKEEKDLVEFHKRKKKNSRMGICRECNSIKCKEYREKIKNGAK